MTNYDKMRGQASTLMAAGYMAETYYDFIMELLGTIERIDERVAELERDRPTVRIR